MQWLYIRHRTIAATFVASPVVAYGRGVGRTVGGRDR